MKDKHTLSEHGIHLNMQLAGTQDCKLLMRKLVHPFQCFPDTHLILITTL